MKLKEKISELDLSWYVLYWDTNSQKALYFNIFTHYIIDNLLKEIKENVVHDKITLKKHLMADFKYYYWSKSEFEFIMTDLTSWDKTEKIDIWRQIEPNLDKITDYVYKNVKTKINNHRG